MSIKITEKILSIPPYISTPWSRIATLHVKDAVLTITLLHGETVQIPNLNPDTIQLIFQFHSASLEQDHSQSIQEKFLPSKGLELGEPLIRFAFAPPMEGLSSMMMMHNPNQADAPDLPPEIVQKIASIIKIINPAGDQVAMPKAEPGCNCFHCQITRSQLSAAPLPVSDDHEVKDEDLKFQQWTITPAGDQLFAVVNRLDDHEKYHVYLGEPIGCTCGKQGCEHILAVLKS